MECEDEGPVPRLREVLRLLEGLGGEVEHVKFEARRALRNLGACGCDKWDAAEGRKCEACAKARKRQAARDLSRGLTSHKLSLLSRSDLLVAAGCCRGQQAAAKASARADARAAKRHRAQDDEHKPPPNTLAACDTPFDVFMLKACVDNGWATTAGVREPHDAGALREAVAAQSFSAWGVAQSWSRLGRLRIEIGLPLLSNRKMLGA